MSLEITVKWSGSDYKIGNLSLEKKVSDLKLEIKNQTGVLPGRQKLLGLKFKGADSAMTQSVSDSVSRVTSDYTTEYNLH